MSELEKYKVLFQCVGCGGYYESKEEAEACFDQDSMKIPTFLEERIASIGEVFPVEIILKRIEGSYIIEIGTYERKNIEKVNIKID